MSSAVAPVVAAAMFAATMLAAPEAATTALALRRRPAAACVHLHNQLTCDVHHLERLMPVRARASAATSHGISVRVRDRLATKVEVKAALSRQQRSCSFPLPVPLPLAIRRHAFSQRTAHLFHALPGAEVLLSKLLVCGMHRGWFYAPFSFFSLAYDLRHLASHASNQRRCHSAMLCGLNHAA